MFESLRKAVSDSNSIPLYLDPIGTPSGTPPALGVCFSGGGSRAMTCAMGQLAAMQAMTDPLDNSQSLMSRVSYISSVSGGTWASVPFTYLPEKIGRQPVSDSEFLIEPVSPSELVKGDADDAESTNVSYLNPLCLGTVAGDFTTENIIDYLISWLLISLRRDVPTSFMWTVAVGQFILEKFDLYSARYKNTVLPSKFYSLSETHVNDVIVPANPSLTADDFYLVRDDRPTLIVNFNMLQDADETPQIPVQATPVSTGVPGQSPDGTIVGGGVCESLGFGSTLTGGTTEAAKVTFDRRFSLCDITACSSAFFAQWLQDHLGTFADAIHAELDKRSARFGLDRSEVSLLQAHLKKLVRQARADAASDRAIVSVVPQYTYWSVGDVGTSVANETMGFSDGGTFENTGLLGLLARTTGDIKAIAFVNCELALSMDEKHEDRLVVDNQISYLFGRQTYDPSTGDYASYGGMTPASPMSYVQVFSDEDGAFYRLLDGLQESSCAGGSTLGAETAWTLQSLVTVDNPVAQIAGGRKVDLLLLYNNRVDAWQQQITDENLIADLQAGQSEKPSGPLKNFPNYSTFFQLCLSAEQVNMLAQLCAWNIQQLEDKVRELLEM